MVTKARRGDEVHTLMIEYLGATTFFGYQVERV